MAKIRSDLLQIFKKSVSAVLPESLIRKSVSYNADNNILTVQNKDYNLKYKNIYVVGTGKAVQAMAKEAEKVIGKPFKNGIISIPYQSYKPDSGHSNLNYLEGAKDNLPDIDATTTAQLVNNLATELKKNDVLLVLISGGGSALLPLPKDTISVAEKQSLIKALANSGADITELNTVRKKISKIKGGKLALTAQPATVITLILSDIVGDPVDLIASGPTVENKDHFLKAKLVVEKYNLYDALPTSVKNILNEREGQVKWPKNKVDNYVIGSNKMSIEEAMNEATSLGYHPIVISSEVTGNVSDIAREYVNLTKIYCDIMSKNVKIKDVSSQMEQINIPGFNAKEINLSIADKKDVCLIFGGETTVKVTGKGKGGRNQQMALEFSNHLNEIRENLQGLDVFFLSAGTDGIDGPTDAAGAIGYIDLVSDSIKEDLDITEYIQDNNAYNFFKKFKNGAFHIVTGHTGTNVMDIQLIMIKKK